MNRIWLDETSKLSLGILDSNKIYFSFQRLGANNSEDSNTATSVTSPTVASPPKQEEPIFVPEVEVPTSPKRSTPELEDISHTPPLAPNMKLLPDVQSKKPESKKSGESKINNWDMFAEQDTFRGEYNVSFFCY